MATHCSILAWRIPRDRGGWWATVHGVTKSQTQLSNAAQELEALVLGPAKLASILKIIHN